MSEEVSKQMTKLLRIGHKCKQTKCKQMSEEFENMKKFILYSNQLNAYYLNVVNDLEDVSEDNQTLLRNERQTLLQVIAGEVTKIERTVRDIISDTEYNDLKVRNITSLDLIQSLIILITVDVTENPV